MSQSDVSHDKVFKTVFRYFLKDLVELVHPELAATLDLDHPKFLDEDLFVDFRKAGHVVPDLVAETATREGEPRLVLVHVEAERERRNTMDARLPRYSMHLTLASDKPVISIVVFLKGGTPGVAIREIRERVGPFEVWRFRYLAFGLSGSLAEEYVGRPQPLAAALAALMRSEVWDKVEQKLRCLEAVSKAEGVDDANRYVLAKIVDTYVELDDDEWRRFAAGLEEHKEIQEMVVTWEEALAEREARGEQRGEERGEQRGRAEATRQAVLVSARHKFGSIPQSFEKKVRAVDDLERLHDLLEQVLDADAIDDIVLR